MDKFYTLDDIKKKNAQYNIIFGERSNGKTSAVLEEILVNYCKKGEYGAVIRRYDEDFKNKRANQLWESIANERELVSKYTNGEWTGITYRSHMWYFTKFNALLNRTIRAENPFCFAFSLTGSEREKGSSYSKITTVLFDEFLTREAYLVNEFVSFTSVLSTIIRHRNNVKIYMCGNTVNKYCPYFDEMGLKNVRKMNPGDLDVYNYGTSGLRVAVHYADTALQNGGKKSDVYFAFDNPKLDMITKGSWELPVYPHAPYKLSGYQVIYMFFIIMDDTILQGDIYNVDGNTFAFIHRKTTDIRGNYPIYTLDFTVNRRQYISLTRGVDKVSSKIADLFVRQKIFYQDNDVGDTVRNYIQMSNKFNIQNL